MHVETTKFFSVVDLIPIRSPPLKNVAFLPIPLISKVIFHEHVELEKFTSTIDMIPPLILSIEKCRSYKIFPIWKVILFVQVKTMKLFRIVDFDLPWNSTIQRSNLYSILHSPILTWRTIIHVIYKEHITRDISDLETTIIHII